VARALGVPVDVLRKSLKKAPTELAPVKVQGEVRLSEAAARWVCVDIVPAINFPAILEKLRPPALPGPPEAPEEKKAAAEPVQGRILSQCPNPLFWRVQVGRTVQVLKEDRASMRGRLRPGVAVAMVPVEGQAYFILRRPA